MRCEAGGAGPEDANYPQHEGAPCLDSETWESTNLREPLLVLASVVRGCILVRKCPADSFAITTPAISIF